MSLQKESSSDENVLYSDISQIIDNSRQRLATTINAEICQMH